VLFLEREDGVSTPNDCADSEDEIDKMMNALARLVLMNMKALQN